MPKKTKKPVKVLCTYRPKKGMERRVLALLKKNWPTLRKAGLVTTEPATLYRATDQHSGKVCFLESFSWKEGEASAAAYRNPAVRKVWDPMGPLIEGADYAVLEPVRSKS